MAVRSWFCTVGICGVFSTTSVMLSNLLHLDCAVGGCSRSTPRSRGPAPANTAPASPLAAQAAINWTAHSRQCSPVGWMKEEFIAGAVGAMFAATAASRPGGKSARQPPLRILWGSTARSRHSARWPNRRLRRVRPSGPLAANLFAQLRARPRRGGPPRLRRADLLGVARRDGRPLRHEFAAPRPAPPLREFAEARKWQTLRPAPGLYKKTGAGKPGHRRVSALRFRLCHCCILLGGRVREPRQVL